ncbi:MAG: RidA family protein [Actinomycetota bacterium]|nr:RidA family protein [Actinomycetota bacterium]
MERRLVSSGSAFESSVGYSRVVRVGNLVFVSGTTATDGRGGVVALGDPYGQAREILDRIGEALAGAGCGPSDVVQTRVYVTDVSRWEEVGRAHGEVFGEVRPATTIVGVRGLVSPEMLVEIEAVAVAPPVDRGE